MRMQAANQVPCWVAGKMTSVLQLTDTDFAHRLKAFSKHEKAQLRQELQAASAKAGVPCSLKCGPFELLKVISASLKRLEQVTLEENLVLAAARRNGMLAWRPSVSQGMLVDAGKQAWCKDVPASCASHRHMFRL